MTRDVIETEIVEMTETVITIGIDETEETIIEIATEIEIEIAETTEETTGETIEEIATVTVTETIEEIATFTKTIEDETKKSVRDDTSESAVRMAAATSNATGQEKVRRGTMIEAKKCFATIDSESNNSTTTNVKN